MNIYFFSFIYNSILSLLYYEYFHVFIIIIIVVQRHEQGSRTKDFRRNNANEQSNCGGVLALIHRNAARCCNVW